MNITPESVFDGLSIIYQLEQPLGGTAPAEVHLFAYLACVLSLYDQHPVDDWGYLFAGTAKGSPFSHAISTALELLEQSGLVTHRDEFFVLTDPGRAEYEVQAALKQNAWRQPYLSGACSSTLALPVGLLREALSKESALDRAAQLERTRPLLEDGDLGILYEQFTALSEAIGVKVSELMVPAIAWLTYLSKSHRANSEQE